MIRTGSVRIALLVGSLSAMPACHSRAQVDRTTESIAGCYLLTWQPWSVGESKPDSAWQTPDIEHRVWLTGTPIAIRAPQPWLVVRPAPGEKASTFGDVRWTWNDATRQVVIEWDATMAGVRLTLSAQDSKQSLVQNLTGAAKWWSTDTPVPPGLTALVHASRETCTVPD